MQVRTGAQDVRVNGSLTNQIQGRGKLSGYYVSVRRPVWRRWIRGAGPPAGGAFGPSDVSAVQYPTAQVVGIDKCRIKASGRFVTWSDLPDSTSALIRVLPTSNFRR